MSSKDLGVFSTKKLNPAVITKFVNHIPAHIQYIDINLNSYNKPEGGDYKLLSNKNHILHLINEYHKAVQKYATNTKRNLKKSLKQNLSLMKNIKPESVIELFRNNRGEQLGKWKEQDRMFLRRQTSFRVLHLQGWWAGSRALPPVRRKGLWRRP